MATPTLPSEYFGIHSLRSLIRNIKKDLQTKLDVADIVDDLETEDPEKVLSANQGRILNGKFKDLNDIVEEMKDMGFEGLKEIDDATIEAMWNEVSGLE